MNTASSKRRIAGCFKSLEADSERLEGRTLREDTSWLTEGVAKAGEVIDESLAKKIAKIGTRGC
jgi:hypothetical protein